MSTAKTIVCFGPGPKFKGGISNYNTSLAKALQAQGHKVHILSWIQQYPAIIPRDFIDRKSRQDLLQGTGIPVTYITDYNNPFTWKQTAKAIADLKPEKVIFQWAISIQGLPLGSIARTLKKLAPQIEIIFDCHLVVQKEVSALDIKATKFGLKVADTYIVHAQKTLDELKKLFPEKSFSVSKDGNIPVEQGKARVLHLYHPVYDMFRENPDLDIEAEKQKLGLNTHVFLFFGFIRKYKGLHQAIEAFALLNEKRKDCSLLIVGESFWNTLDSNKLSTRIKKILFGSAKKLFLNNSDNEEDYKPLELIQKLKLEKQVVVFNEFIPNEEVHRYFQVSDALILFYLTATPSGVESIGYNFKMPILATKVGHFAETVIPGYNGYLANAEDIKDMARIMELSISNPIDRNNVVKTANNMSWNMYASAVAK